MVPVMKPKEFRYRHFLPDVILQCLRWYLRYPLSYHTFAREPSEQNIGLKVLTGQGANIDTTTPAGRLIFGIFASLADFESELIRERTNAGLIAARARGRNGGRKFHLTKSQVRMLQVVMQNRETSIVDLCQELNITRSTLYRHVSPTGEIRERGKKLLKLNLVFCTQPQTTPYSPCISLGGKIFHFLQNISLCFIAEKLVQYRGGYA